MHHVVVQSYTEPVNGYARALETRTLEATHDVRELCETLLAEQAGVDLPDSLEPPVLSVAALPREQLQELTSNDWTEFFARFPDSHGLTKLSSIGFDPARKRAMVVVSLGASSYISSAVAYVLVKSGALWQVDSEHWLVITIG